MKSKKFTLLTMTLPQFAQALQRSAMIALMIGAQLPASAAHADGASEVIKITAINGTYDPNHSVEVNIHAGDVVNLSADFFDATQDMQAEQRPVEDFVWSSNAKENDVCDASAGDDCLATSNFQINDYGVSFYAPTDMGESIQISVYPHDGSTVDADGNPLSDTITLRNLDFQPNVPVPPVVVLPQPVVDPISYPSPVYEPVVALQGYGNWVTIDGVRYFSPRGYVVPGEAEWAPYRNGHWAWEEGDGWTWISYDPWGWATDHYGVWRYHATYGWIWLPFEDRHYVPCAVTWFHDNGYVGWYPYYDGYREGYRSGRVEGFIDGFNRGFSAGLGIGARGYIGHSGFTVVQERNVTVINISKIVVNRTTIVNQTVINVVNNSFHNHTFAPAPGGHAGIASRQFIEARTQVTAPLTKAVVVTTQGGAQIRQPMDHRVLPPNYVQVAKVIGAPSNRPLAVGTVSRISIGHQGEVKLTAIAPTIGPKGLAPAPVRRDEKGVPVQVLPAQARVPAQRASGNPLSSAPMLHPVLPVASHENPMPHLNPALPPPPPIMPRPAPMKPAPPAPAPLPHPAPAPQPPRPAPAPAPQPPRPAPAPAPQPPRPAPAPQPPRPGPQPPHRAFDRSAQPAQEE